jgi:hypothetical protein
MKKVTITLDDFERVSSSQGNVLVGGFSLSYTAPSIETNFAFADNNCKGGNCTQGCGGNTGCNTVDGCGVKL